MKVEINETKKERDFPKLMISGGVIILMTSEKTGLCIESDDHGYYESFEYRDDWRMDEFKDFEGSITLSND